MLIGVANPKWLSGVRSSSGPGKQALALVVPECNMLLFFNYNSLSSVGLGWPRLTTFNLPSFSGERAILEEQQ